MLFRTGIVLDTNKGIDCLLGSRDAYPRQSTHHVALAGSLVIFQRSLISSIRCLAFFKRILRSLIVDERERER